MMIGKNISSYKNYGFFESIISRVFTIKNGRNLQFHIKISRPDAVDQIDLILYLASVQIDTDVLAKMFSRVGIKKFLCIKSRNYFLFPTIDNELICFRFKMRAFDLFNFSKNFVVENLSNFLTAAN